MANEEQAQVEGFLRGALLRAERDSGVPYAKMFDAFVARAEASSPATPPVERKQDREGRHLNGVTAVQLIDLLQTHVDTHGNSEVLVDTNDGFGLTVGDARSRESMQSNPLVFVLEVDTQDEPQQLGE